MLNILRCIWTRRQIGERPASILDNPVSSWLNSSLCSGEPGKRQLKLVERFLLWLGF